MFSIYSNIKFFHPFFPIEGTLSWSWEKFFLGKATQWLIVDFKVVRLKSLGTYKIANIIFCFKILQKKFLPYVFGVEKHKIVFLVTCIFFFFCNAAPNVDGCFLSCHKNCFWFLLQNSCVPYSPFFPLWGWVRETHRAWTELTWLATPSCFISGMSGCTKLCFLTLLSGL